MVGHMARPGVGASELSTFELVPGPSICPSLVLVSAALSRQSSSNDAMNHCQLNFFFRARQALV